MINVLFSICIQN